jgi:ABC-2 type transport system permease protein
LFRETFALTLRDLRKWVRNPASIMPGLFTALFYLVLFGNSFNPANLIPSNSAGQASSIVQTMFGGAPTYITYLASGVICIILIFNMSFGGIDLVIDRQFGYLNSLLTAPIPRSAIFLSGVAQNLVKVLVLGLLTFMVALVIPNGLQLPSSFNALDFIGVFGAFAFLGLGFSFIFTALALSVRTIDSLVAIVNFLNLPVMFMSNAFFPPSSFPAWLRTIANLNPVTKANEAVRLIVFNESLTAAQVSTYVWDMAYLVGFAVVLGTIGYSVARRALSPE